MTKRRVKMVARLGPQPAAGGAWGLRAAAPADRQALAGLLIEAYRGTVDDEGETPEEALAEIDRTFAGAYGAYLGTCSFLAEAEGVAAGACLITSWTEAPLVAYIMVAPRFQGRGLGERLLRASMAALYAQGNGELVLFVTDGNAPAQRLYRRLGFAVVRGGA